MSSSLSLHSSPPLSHPFSAAHKAHPGQLPSFSLDHYYSQSHFQKTSNPILHSSQHAPPCPSLSTSSAQLISSAHSLSSPSTHPKLFSPALAGEPDRNLRSRIQSTPVTAPNSSNDWLSIDSDDSLDQFWLADDSQPCSAYKLEPRRLFTTPDYPHQSPLAFKPRPGIFFAHPPGLDSACVITNHRRNSLSDREIQLSRESSEDRFLMAISSAISRGDSVVDLDHRGICSIPVLTSTLDGHGSEKDLPRVRMASNLIQQLLTPPSIRTGMTRVRSAPTVSFGPARSVSLYLSNNYLSSASSLERLGALRGLQRLSLRANRLTEIPSGLLEGLTSLVELNLTNNQLRWLPSAVTQLDHCKIYLSGNPWLERPPEAADAPRYVSPLVQTSPLLPTLVELCLRRLCVLSSDTGSTEESLRPYPCPNQLTLDWPGGPEKIKQTLREPQKELLKCNCCGRWVSRLPVERIEWRKVGNSKLIEQDIVPVKWVGCGIECLKNYD